jgi:NADH:ubiquinone oxidoreductase subunit 5 (subunit L)/multisubunit Na+/H+ antiporter MnhA subunit
VFVRPYVWLSNALWLADQNVIDGTVNGVATAVVANGQLWRYAQDGNVQHYALVFLGGAVALLSYYLVR